MKTFTLITLVLGLAATTASAEMDITRHDGRILVPTPSTAKWVPDHILHPKPKLKIKIPTPGCLSCPGVAVGDAAITLPAMR